MFYRCPVAIESLQLLIEYRRLNTWSGPDLLRPSGKYELDQGSGLDIPRYRTCTFLLATSAALR